LRQFGDSNGYAKRVPIGNVVDVRPEAQVELSNKGNAERFECDFRLWSVPHPRIIIPVHVNAEVAPRGNWILLGLVIEPIAKDVWVKESPQWCLPIIEVCQSLDDGQR